MKKLIFIAILIFPFFSFSQTEEDTTVYKVVEKMPEFPGGEEKLYEYLGKNITYETCLDYHKFKLYISFIIEKDGSISNVKEAKNDEEKMALKIINAIKNMPKWIPGEQEGKKVRVKYILPVLFCPR